MLRCRHLAGVTQALPPGRLRSWTSSGSSCHSSSSQPERGPSPSLLNTVSLDTMPKFAFSSEDEGAGPASVDPKKPVFILGEPDPPPPTTPVMREPSSLSGKWGLGGREAVKSSQKRAI